MCVCNRQRERERRLRILLGMWERGKNRRESTYSKLQGLPHTALQSFNSAILKSKSNSFSKLYHHGHTNEIIN